LKDSNKPAKPYVILDSPDDGDSNLSQKKLSNERSADTLVKADSPDDGELRTAARPAPR